MEETWTNAIKQHITDALLCCDTGVPSREMALVKTKLQEAALWLTQIK